jgi:hypothetical protein
MGYPFLNGSPMGDPCNALIVLNFVFKFECIGEIFDLKKIFGDEKIY